MNNFMYTKMALSNIRKNGKLYIPYTLTIVGCLFFYFTLGSLADNPNIVNPVTGEKAFRGADLLVTILFIGRFVTIAFEIGFLFDSYEYIFKQQKKQLGLYRVLGMERRHLVRLVIYEILFMFGIGFILGAGIGVLFNKLIIVWLFNIIDQPIPTGFHISVLAIKGVFMQALISAVLILLRCVISLLRMKDVDLLKSDKEGEHEPKARLLTTILGVVLLGIGYFVATRENDALTAITLFFPASGLVIAATYLLFISGSISLLKFLKRRKGYYYTTKHFVSVSGMLYRMKKNATSLASICIFSTSAIIVLAAGTALYTNGERSLNELFPKQIQVDCRYDEFSTQAAILEEGVKQTGCEVKELVTLRFGNTLLTYTPDGLINEYGFWGDYEVIPDVYILTLEDYCRATGDVRTLEDGEVLLYQEKPWVTENRLMCCGREYQVVGEARNTLMRYMRNAEMTVFKKMLLVVKQQQDMDDILAGEEPINSKKGYFGFDLENEEDEIAVKNMLAEYVVQKEIYTEVSCRQEEENEFLGLYGGIFFIGIVLGSLFLMATILIIYYKQMAEGIEDQNRFSIMQKVGLTKKEIRATIRAQVLRMFFMPLITAIIHASFALPLVVNCLKLVLVIHMPTFILSFVITCIVFSAIYIIAYLLTSREYYKIVS